MIVEGLVTTLNADGSVNLAPMGPVVNEDLTTFLFRPFKTSTTYQNLKRTGFGVFHVTDRVDIIAQAAVSALTIPLEFAPAEKIPGAVLTSSCRWFEFQMTQILDELDRTEIHVEILHEGRLRDFFGLNRAKHAVIEAAILSTRLHLVAKAEILQQFAQLRPLVEKTGGSQECQAFEFLENYVQTAIVSQTSDSFTTLHALK